MKKLISVLLSILMVVSCVVCAFAAFAQDEAAEPYAGPTYCCTCEDCLGTADCKCCIYCEYTAKRMGCVHFDESNGGIAVYCCEKCSGWLGCTCGESEDPANLCECIYCRKDAQNGEDPAAGQDQIISSDAQKSIIAIFQNVLGQVSAIFDKLFDAVFKFLRIDEFEDLFKR